MSLESRMPRKRFFDPKSKADMAVVKKFMKTMAWGRDCCPFYLEYPYKSVPAMIKDKIVYNIVGVKL
jgi:hypothetical protein